MNLFKKSFNHKVTDGSCRDHLEVMRANYHENIITSKSLPKPLWIRLHRKDALNVIYRDKDIVFQNGQIYYAYLVQANEMLFQKDNNLNLPANVIYSTHPIAESYPEFLMDIGSEMFKYKGMPEDKIPEAIREVVRIITDELDRSSVDFTVSFPDPENSDKIIDNIDVHFCSVIVFHKDIPNHMLQGSFLPVLAAPDLSPAVLILPREYWTMPYYDFEQ